MNMEEAIREQRASFRCVVPESRQSCELKIGSGLVPAVLVDESAGGFSVALDRPPGLDAGQTAELHTDAGWFAVRVAHVKPIVASEGDDPVATEEPSQWFRLGLVRMEEIRAPLPPRVSRFAGNLLNKLWPSREGGGRSGNRSFLRLRLGKGRRLGGKSAILIGILVAIIVVAAPSHRCNSSGMPSRRHPASFRRGTTD